MQNQKITGLFIFVCLINITGLVFAEEITPSQVNLNLVERLAKFEEGQKAIVTEMRTRFEAIDNRFEMLIKNIDKRFEAVDNRFEMLIKNIDKRFEAIDNRFEMLIKNIDRRFEAIDNRFEMLEKSIDKRFDAIDNRFEMLEKSIDKRFDSIDKRFDAMSNQVTTLFMLFSAIIAAIIALIAYIIWDRKTVMASHEKKYHAPEQVEKMESEPAIVLDSQNTNNANQKIVDGFKIPKSIQDDLRNVVNYMNQFPEMRPILQPT
jgi:chaperonin cofactor prefoldin